MDSFKKFEWRLFALLILVFIGLYIIIHYAVKWAEWVLLYK